MIAASFSRVVGVLMLIVVFLSTSCSVYPNPTVDLVLHVRDVDAGHRVLAVLDEFARQRKLTAYPAGSDSTVPESIRLLNEKTTYYLTGTRYGEGRSLTYLDASPACKVIRVVELSEKWSEESEADLIALRTALRALTGVTVDEGARFIPDTRSGRGIDEYCPADVSSQTPAA